MEMTNITNEEIENLFNGIGESLDIPDTPVIRLEQPNSDSEIITGMNEAFAMKQRLYENVLAPQLKYNERLKRRQKRALMNKIFQILSGQFIAIYVFVGIVLLATGTSKWLGLSDALLVEMISFIKFYITSIIAELIAILFFIVKNVFDTSIADLFKNFDSDSKEKKDPNNN